jgi:hypothetical protein
MTRFHIVILIAATICLGGCITFPQTLEEFRSSASGQLSFMEKEPLQSAYDTVAKNTVRCHEGDTSQMSMVGKVFFVSPDPATRIEGSLDDTAGTAVVSVRYYRPGGGGLLQVIDLKRNAPNETQIIVYKINDTTKWKTAAQSVQDWFNGGTGCYRMF